MNYIRATPTQRNPSPLWHIERGGKPACRVPINVAVQATTPPAGQMCPKCTESLRILRRQGKL